MPEPSRSFERLDPRDYRRSPWKNGGGVTVDIASAHLPGAASGGWSGVLWRFGRTRIERPGPFSDLSGYDRNLSVIEGRGLVLRPASAPAIDVRQAFRPVSFPGEWAIESELEHGPVGVLNLMTDRRYASGDVRFLAAGDELAIEAQILILFAPRGRTSLVLDTHRFELDEDEAVLARAGAFPSEAETRPQNGDMSTRRTKFPIRHQHGIVALASISLHSPDV